MSYLHFAQLISFKNGASFHSWSYVNTSGLGWMVLELLCPAAAATPDGLHCWVFCVTRWCHVSSPQEKALLPGQTVILDTAMYTPDLGEKPHQRDCWQLLEVGVMQKLHSVPLATDVNEFVIMLEPFLSGNSKHLP